MEEEIFLKTQHLDAFMFGVHFQKPGNNVVRCWCVVHRYENIHQRAVNNNFLLICIARDED